MEMFDQNGNDKTLDRAAALKDAENLYASGEGQWGTDECVFNMIMSNRSWGQLKKIFNQYQVLSKKSILEAIRSEFSGDIMATHLAIAKFALVGFRWWNCYTCAQNA